MLRSSSVSLNSPLAADVFLFTAPTVAPNFTVEDTSADSILVKWEDIPVEELRGFLRGYLFYFEKGERDTSKIRGLESGKSLNYSGNIS